MTNTTAVDYAALFTTATTATSAKGAGPRSSTAEVRFESDGNGKARIAFPTGMKKILIADGTFAKYVKVAFLDQRDDDNTGKILVFVTFTSSSAGAVAVSNSVDDDGVPINKNISYVTALSSLAASVNLDHQEVYGTYSKDEFVRIPGQSTYHVTVTAKTQTELEELISDDNQKIADFKIKAALAEKAAKALAEETAASEETEETAASEDSDLDD